MKMLASIAAVRQRLRRRGLANGPALAFVVIAGTMASVLAAQPSVAGTTTILSWGTNVFGELGRAPVGGPNALTPIAVQSGAGAGACTAAALNTATQISAGGWHGLALLPNHTVCAWGINTHEELGRGAGPATAVPRLVCAAYSANTSTCAPLKNVIAVSAGGFYSLALLSSFTLPGGTVIPNVVMAWGGAFDGELGTGTALANLGVPELVCRTVTVPVAVAGFNCPLSSPASAFLQNVKAISAGEYNSLALKTTGKVVAWGENTYCELGIGNFCNPPLHHGPYSHGCDPSGSASPTDCSVDPVQVHTAAAGNPALGGAVAISAGNVQDAALLANGTVMTWGDNDRGQLGNGTFAGPDSCFNNNSGINASFPCGWFAANVMGNPNSKVCRGETAGAASPLNTVVAVKAGFPDDLALLKDHFVCSWGDNAAGELGNGPTATAPGPSSAFPVAVWNVGGSPSNLLQATAIASGIGENNLAITTRGQVAAWGNGLDGELGNGTAGPLRAIPVDVCAVPGCPAVLGGVTQISAGGHHDYAFP